MKSGKYTVKEVLNEAGIKKPVADRRIRIGGLNCSNDIEKTINVVYNEDGLDIIYGDKDFHLDLEND